MSHKVLKVTIQGTRACKLHKSFYGLKPSPQAWFERFTKVLKLDGYSQCQSNHSLFAKHSANGNLAILIAYVDYLVVIGNHEEEFSHLKHYCLRNLRSRILAT